MENIEQLLNNWFQTGLYYVSNFFDLNNLVIFFREISENYDLKDFCINLAESAIGGLNTLLFNFPTFLSNFF